MARVLVVFRQGPHGSVRAREGLEVALAALAFEHEVSVYFCGDGVALLRRGQHTDAALVKDFCRGFRALGLHGLRRAGVSADAMREHGLSRGGLLLDDAVALNAAQAAAWMSEADAVFSS
jgi:tRNA 2-thiouridine synthesizing protein C